MIRTLILRWQFMRGGASWAESKELAATSRYIESMLFTPPFDAKDDIARQIGFRPVHVKQRRRFEFAGALATCLVLVVVAQAAMPGSTLYALKRGTEEVRLAVQPGFKKQVVERRKDELNELKHHGGDDHSIRRAEDDYRKSLQQAGEVEGGHQSGKDQTQRSDSGADDATTSGGGGGSADDSSTSGGSGKSSGGDSGGSGSGRDHPEDD